ncbi:hypothetical protein AU152_gp81 [Mycobacterium phage Phlei]|uniref:Uncharacterized protein n=1 Tax=Mycobacterium phage Phlei TaxID=1690684 RepID=A0A0N9BDT2_9CAUD|nr:hypothetical protein AU152_gp81 [Mycobacterium phage Phlei]ALA48194.1 hypothetical protein [Mycobacterium phage Phlei]
MADQWVNIVFLQGDEYDNIADMSIEELVGYLAYWDYGSETDFADTRDGEPWGSADDLYEVEDCGTTYTLSINRAIGYVGLHRRPLD